jgi:hypothetical protein
MNSAVTAPLPDSTSIQVSGLVVQTLELTAIHANEIVGHAKETSPGHVWLKVKASDEDVPFLLGGRGANIRAVSELANLAMPQGTYLTIDVSGPDHHHRRHAAPIDIPPMSKLDEAFAHKLILVVQAWHQAIWHQAIAHDFPCVDIESTASCDCLIVDRRNLNAEALGALRRVVGWAAKTHGRIGFIEWRKG